MADHRIIAQQRHKALGRINSALESLSQGQDKPFDPMPMHGRDALVLQRDQMNWIADTLERIAATPIVESLEDEPPVAKTKKAHDADRDTEDPDAAPRANTVTPKSSKGKS